MRYRILMLVIAVLFAFPSLVAAQPTPPEIEGGTIVATGFNGPQGITIDADGNLWVIDSGVGGDEEIPFVSEETGEPTTTKMGPSARIVMVSPDGEQTDVATLPSIMASETEALGGARLTGMDGTLYATVGGWVGGAGDPPDLAGVVARVEGGDVAEVADMWAYEAANNPDGLTLEAHPYGITAGPEGWLWIANAGANTLDRVNPDTGEIQNVAVFDGLTSPIANPARNNAMEADPVPTAVVFDDMGDALVSLLSGAPFVPGSAKMLRVTPDGQVSDFATGLTMLTDLQRGPDGELYAVEFGMFTEQGPVPNAGSVVRIHEGDASEVLVSGLPFPTSLVFDADGNAYVTINGVGAPGSGAVVRFDALTGMEGEPVTTGQ
jgi:sugar lactone lactonase YvrE